MAGKDTREEGGGREGGWLGNGDGGEKGTLGVSDVL